MLNVDGEKIEVPDPNAWDVVLMEERFHLSLLWAQAVPVSYATRITDGVKVLPPILAQSTDMKYPISIPTIPRMLDALLDQARCRVIYAENFPGKLGNRPKYHLQDFVRYLHLEKHIGTKMPLASSVLGDFWGLGLHMREVVPSTLGDNA